MRRNNLLLGWMACGGSGCLSLVLVMGILFFRFVYHSPYLEFNKHNTKGNQYYSAHKFAAAAAEYTEMTKVQPHRDDGYFLRGMAYYRMGRYDKAIQDNTTVLNMRGVPASVVTAAYYNRGLDYKSKGDIPQAIADFDMSLMRKPSDGDASANRSECYRLQGDPDSGTVQPQADYRKNLQQYNNLINAAIADTSKQQYRDAEKSLKDAIQLCPADPVAYANLGWTQYLNGEVSNAIRTTKTALKIDGNLAYARFNMGVYYASQNNWSDAKSNYDAGLKFASITDINNGLQDVHDAHARFSDASSTLDKAADLLQTANPFRPGTIR